MVCCNHPESEVATANQPYYGAVACPCEPIPPEQRQTRYAHCHLPGPSGGATIALVGPAFIQGGAQLLVGAALRTQQLVGFCLDNQAGKQQTPRVLLRLSPSTGKSYSCRWQGNSPLRSVPAGQGQSLLANTSSPITSNRGSTCNCWGDS